MANEEIDKATNTAVAPRKSFIPTSTAGTEGITSEDVRLPRVGIAQGLSPQITPDSSSYIDNLKLYEMFNDLTGEVYGRGPVGFIPVRRDVRRIEYRPRDEGGGVVDLDVPAGDPRTKWTGEGDDRQPPRATKYVEFVILLVRPGREPEPIVLSIKDTNKFNRRAAERLTGFIMFNQPPIPIYAKRYTLETKPEKNDQGTFGVPVINLVGRLDAPEQTEEQWAESQKLYQRAEMLHNALKGKTIQVNREPGSDDEFEVPEDDPAMRRNDGDVSGM